MVDRVSPVTDSGLGEALRGFVDNPPLGTPADVLELLVGLLHCSDGRVPPSAFIAAAEQMPVALSITDLKANILYTNRAFSRVTGYDSEEVVGRNESVLSDRNTPVSIYQALWASLLDGRSWSGTVVNRRRDGERYLASLLVTPVLGSDGQAHFYLGMHRDVTEEHRLEREVSNQKQLIESMLDAMPMAVALLDEGGGLVRENSAHERLAQTLEMPPLACFLPGIEREHGALFSAQSNRAQAFRDIEVAFEPGGGRAVRWFACSGSWLAEHDPSVDNYFQPRLRHYLLLVVQEITSLKQRAEMHGNTVLRALMAEEERAEGMCETITAASYQLQGPINMLNASIAMAARRSNEGDPLVGVLTQTLEAGQEALDTLERARPTPHYGSQRRLNINQLLRDVVGVATERLLKEGIVVEWEPTPVLPPVYGYEKRLRSLFKRILDNAIDAISEGRCRERSIRLVSSYQLDVINVEITDSGPGITTEERFKVFEPFFTTRRATGHVGMGLAVAQEIANQHAATIALEEVADGGTRVRVEIPIAHKGGEM